MNRYRSRSEGWPGHRDRRPSNSRYPRGPHYGDTPPPLPISDVSGLEFDPQGGPPLSPQSRPWGRGGMQGGRYSPNYRSPGNRRRFNPGNQSPLYMQSGRGSPRWSGGNWNGNRQQAETPAPLYGLYERDGPGNGLGGGYSPSYNNHNNNDGGYGRENGYYNGDGYSRSPARFNNGYDYGGNNGPHNYTPHSQASNNYSPQGGNNNYSPNGGGNMNNNNNNSNNNNNNNTNNASRSNTDMFAGMPDMFSAVEQNLDNEMRKVFGNMMGGGGGNSNTNANMSNNTGAIGGGNGNYNNHNSPSPPAGQWGNRGNAGGEGGWQAQHNSNGGNASPYNNQPEWGRYNNNTGNFNNGNYANSTPRYNVDWRDTGNGNWNNNNNNNSGYSSGNVANGSTSPYEVPNWNTNPNNTGNGWRPNSNEYGHQGAREPYGNYNGEYENGNQNWKDRSPAPWQGNGSPNQQYYNGNNAAWGTSGGGSQQGSPNGYGSGNGANGNWQWQTQQNPPPFDGYSQAHNAHGDPAPTNASPVCFIYPNSTTAGSAGRVGQVDIWTQTKPKRGRDATSSPYTNGSPESDGRASPVFTGRPIVLGNPRDGNSRDKNGVDVSEIPRDSIPIIINRGGKSPSLIIHVGTTTA